MNESQETGFRRLMVDNQLLMLCAVLCCLAFLFCFQCRFSVGCGSDSNVKMSEVKISGPAIGTFFIAIHSTAFTCE